MSLPEATVREEIAGYVGTVLYVYALILIAYLLSTLFLGFGGRVPYNRALRAVLDFLRDVSEPYLRLFRRLIPPLGPVDLSPLIAILVLSVGGGLLQNLIAG